MLTGAGLTGITLTGITLTDTVVSQAGSSTASGATTTFTITNSYQWRDGALLKTVNNVQSGGTIGTTSSTLSYDANAAGRANVEIGLIG